MVKPLTPFQRKVYTVVRTIPKGEVRTYAWIAKKVGRCGANKAVGTALKKNPFTLIVPCHRVIRSDGSLGEFALGADLKKKLLEVEGVAFNPGLQYSSSESTHKYSSRHRSKSICGWTSREVASRG